MAKILFSHKYNKMPVCILDGNCKQAMLLEVLTATKNELSSVFIEYDTRTIKGDYYNLPNGILIVLLLITDNEMWTTARSYNEEKYEYYKKLRGKMINIEITGE